MDPFDNLPVRFHLGGQFDFDGDSVNYVGGRVEMSHIERDKLSLPELKGHLADHIALTPEYNINFHWLLPDGELSSGLRQLDDDKACLSIAECVTRGVVAEIYVEMYKYEGDDIVMWSPSGVMTQEHESANDSDAQDDTIEGNKDGTIDDSDFEDEDYLVGDENTSEDDEEAKEFRNNAMNQRKNPASSTTPSAPITLTKLKVCETDDGDINHDIPDPPMMDSSDEASYDEEEDGEGLRRQSRFARFDSKAEIPIFSLGMTFRGRKEFKEALIKYGLATRRHLNFPKDEIKRIRAKCSWPNCLWMIFASTRSDSDWFQVKTFNDVHVCPKRKDNRLVSSTRIADKYESIIRANPSWKLLSIKETVLKQMGADVSLSKVKRAKSIVMKRIFEAAKGEYSKMFEYQAEILRSNPGSTAVVYLDPEYNMPVFQRFYVCFDACKKGFLAGCRKVFGLNGCFSKRCLQWRVDLCYRKRCKQPDLSDSMGCC